MNEEKPVTSDNKKLSPEEIKRVKGLGCLQDKRYDDIFNIRVITGNGHITTDEHRAIADAADKFGNGQITMTTRLSMEIQGVPYDNIEKTIAFLGEHGLMTGGTGAKVRPVVSCKGTTCHEEQELVICMMSDVKGHFLGDKILTRGTATGSLVTPREIFMEALRRHAVSLILIHNHPSGDPTPSPDDLQITARIYQAGELLGIHLLDHIVIGDQRYCSFREEGLWNTCTE